MRIAILDDDIVFCDSLKNYLLKYNFDIHIFTNYQNLKETINTYDLLLLDIEMPLINGIDIVNSLSSYSPDVIFVTSHIELMKYCFHRNVIGFVHKDNIKEIDDILKKATNKPYLKIKKSGEDFNVLFERIAYIEYSLRDITLHLVNNEQIVLPEKSLVFFLNKLDDRFYQINRNIIVNLDMKPRFNNGRIWIQNAEFMVSRRKQKDLKIKIIERSIHLARNL